MAGPPSNSCSISPRGMVVDTSILKTSRSGSESQASMDSMEFTSSFTALRSGKDLIASVRTEMTVPDSSDSSEADGSSSDYDQNQHHEGGEQAPQHARRPSEDLSELESSVQNQEEHEEEVASASDDMPQIEEEKSSQVLEEDDQMEEETSPTEEEAITRRISKPIMKSPLADPKFIKNNAKLWKTMSAPDLDQIFSQAQQRCSAPLSSTKSDSYQGKKQVEFHEVLIRAYSQTMGDNPSVSYGTPIQLDWDYEECEPLHINDYEGSRGNRRGMRQMVLSHYQRKNILQFRYDFTDEEIRQQKKKVNAFRTQRDLTRSLLPVMKLEDALESTKRKFKRRFLKRGESA